MTRARAWQLRMRAQARCQRCGKSLGWRSVRYCHPCLDKSNMYLRKRRKAKRYAQRKSLNRNGRVPVTSRDTRA